MRFKYCTFFLLFFTLIYGQNNSIDTLKEYTYNDLQKTFYQYNQVDEIKEAKSISKYYLQKAKKEKNKDQISEGYVLAHFNESLPCALKYIDSLTAITKNSTKNTYPARTYLLKGNLFFNDDNIVKALENYILGLKYAKEKKNKRQIAIAELGIANINNYIGKHPEATKILRYYLYNTDYLNESELQDIRLNLASTYLDINNIDSAYILIKDGLIFSKNDPYIHNKYLSLFGLYSLKQKNYKIAIDSLNKSENFFITKKNDMALNYALLYLSQSYAKANQKENAARNFIKIDSIVQKTNNTFPELRDVYTYLIDYYKEKNDKEKQLYYIDRFLKVDKILDSQHWILSKELPKKYDTPNLLKEKESIIRNLENKKTILYLSIIILLTILIFLTYLYLKSKKEEKMHKKIAHDLIHKVHESNRAKLKEDINAIIIQPKDIKQQKRSNISKDLIQTILKELENFESKEYFLNKGITLGSLSKKVKTNPKYLSEIINAYKGKNFAAYLNDLRIDYAITRLAKDKKFQSYKIISIAEELGYNNEQAFTIAFKKKTGTTVSIYLKEIENTKMQEKTIDN